MKGARSLCFGRRYTTIGNLAGNPWYSTTDYPSTQTVVECTCVDVLPSGNALGSSDSRHVILVVTGVMTSSTTASVATSGEAGIYGCRFGTTFRLIDLVYTLSSGT